MRRAKSLGRNRADHSSPVLLGRRFELAEFEQLFDYTIHHLPAFFDMSHLTTSEEHRHLDLVLVLQEANRFLHLEANVMLTCFRSESNLLGPRVVAVLVSFLLLFVLIFAVVHDSANRGPFVRCHLNKIKAGFDCTLECVSCFDDS